MTINGRYKDWYLLVRGSGFREYTSTRGKMACSSRKHPSTNSVSDPAEMWTCDSDRWFRQFKILTPRGGWRSQSRAIRGDLHRGSCRRDEIRQWVGRQGISPCWQSQRPALPSLRKGIEKAGRRTWTQKRPDERERERNLANASTDKSPEPEARYAW